MTNFLVTLCQVLEIGLINVSIQIVHFLCKTPPNEALRSGYDSQNRQSPQDFYTCRVDRNVQISTVKILQLTSHSMEAWRRMDWS